MQCMHISTYINTWMLRKIHKSTYIYETSFIKNIHKVFRRLLNSMPLKQYLVYSKHYLTVSFCYNDGVCNLVN